MNNWELVIGIEIHIELNTKTKMFSPILNNYDSTINSNVSNIDLAYPGTLPLVNKEAIIKGLKLAKALNMQIDSLVRFDRKNYFYFDLPKGYQITQQFNPIGKEGKIKAKVDGVWKDIEIERIHLEEDTAKSIYEGNDILLNYNRAGVPLIEIVSKPVMHSAKEAAAYVDAIRLMALYLDISDAKMNEGSLRVDVNVSTRKKGTNVLNTKVEIKNLNSIANVEKAINFEFLRQVKCYESNKEVSQETRKFDEQKLETVVMRKKGNAEDYKYFPEPNILPILISKEVIDSVKLNTLPFEKEKEYLAKGLNELQISQFINNLAYASFFEKIDIADFKKKANLFFSNIVPFLNDNKLDITDLKILLPEVKELFNYLIEGKIDKKNVMTILDLKQKNSAKSLKEIIESQKMFMEVLNISLEEIVDEIFKENPNLLKDFNNNFDKNKKYLIGQIMKKTQGKAKLEKLDIILTNKVK